jgi:hypothetical protein
MPKKFLFSFLAITFIIFSCHTTKNIDNSKSKVLLFGNGGGFTGQETEYVLDENGTFMKNDRLKSEVTILPTLKKSEIKVLFKELDRIRFDTIHFNHPGNTYYFITVTQNDNSHEVVWGEHDNLPPASILQFYDLLISKTK